MQRKAADCGRVGPPDPSACACSHADPPKSIMRIAVCPARHPLLAILTPVPPNWNMKAIRDVCYTYRVTWSEDDREYVGLCAEFPSLSWLASVPEAALRGIRSVVAGAVADIMRRRLAEAASARFRQNRATVCVLPQVTTNCDAPTVLRRTPRMVLKFWPSPEAGLRRDGLAYHLLESHRPGAIPACARIRFISDQSMSFPCGLGMRTTRLPYTAI